MQYNADIICQVCRNHFFWDPVPGLRLLTPLLFRRVLSSPFPSQPSKARYTPGKGSIVMEERRARLLQRRGTRLRIQHIDVLALLRVRDLHALAAAEEAAHRLVLRACAAVLDGGEGSRRGVEHALGVGEGLCFVEDVFGWGEGPDLFVLEMK